MDVLTAPATGMTVDPHVPTPVSSAAIAQPSAGVPSTPRGTETVLLVEDEDQVRTLVRSVLARQGYRVLAASRSRPSTCSSSTPTRSICC